MRYASKKNATQYDAVGNLKCDRCGRVLNPWPYVRSDNCGNAPLSPTCMRTFDPVLAGWERERAKQTQVAS